ncbi:tetratricopeptide repeat protein [Pedobacter sp. WC2423]|uniref:tetratricopeptide repeat protein n=1 Tax=Pedobacter sp. WC2423 TaxID=3234142 RepID=UPI003466263F
MMKKRYLFAVTILMVSSTSAFSQKTQLYIARNSVGKLQAAIANKQDQKTQLAILGEGIKAAEAAEKDRETKKWPETWALKSYLSSYIAITDPSQDNSDKYFDLAINAIDSANRFDKFEDNSGLIKASSYNVNIKKQQKGKSAYQAKDFSAAYKYLKEVSDFFPKDTILAVNAALSAEGVKNEDEALAYYKRAKDNGIMNAVVFQRMADIYKRKLDNDLALKTLQEGLIYNPYNDLLNNDYINLLLDTEKYTEARQVIENTLKVDTRSKLLYYLYGYLHQKNTNMGTAELAYNKALEIDRNYFDALYQLGLVYLNLSNDALAAPKKDILAFTSNLNRAEIILSQAHQVNKKDKPTINLLIDIYTRKNRFDRAQELKAQLEEF